MGFNISSSHTNSDSILTPESGQCFDSLSVRVYLTTIQFISSHDQVNKWPVTVLLFFFYLVITNTWFTLTMDIQHVWPCTHSLLPVHKIISRFTRIFPYFERRYRSTGWFYWSNSIYLPAYKRMRETRWKKKEKKGRRREWRRGDEEWSSAHITEIHLCGMERKRLQIDPFHETIKHNRVCSSLTSIIPQ